MKTLAVTIVMTMMTVINANAGNNTWRNPSVPTPPHTEVHHTAAGRYHTDWRHCNHNRMDRHGNRTYCHDCGSEMVWRGTGRRAHYEIIPPRPTATPPRPTATPPHPTATHNHGGPYATAPNHF